MKGIMENTVIETRITELERKQKEQDNKIKQLEEKVKFASIGFPVNNLF